MCHYCELCRKCAHGRVRIGNLLIIIKQARGHFCAILLDFVSLSKSKSRETNLSKRKQTPIQNGASCPFLATVFILQH